MLVPRCLTPSVSSASRPIYFRLRHVAADEHPFGENTGRWAFWLYNGGLALWILFNFFPIG
jgi:nitric oxide reductase subunit B